jgi:membrane-bound lytic murein transglycosylase D
MVRRWNGIRGDSLHGRRVLALHLPVTPNTEVASTTSRKPAAHSKKPAQTVSAKAPAGKSEATGEKTSQQTSVVHHKVKSGETLYSIAATYKTTVAALKRSNQNVATLRPGMILVVQQNQ